MPSENITVCEILHANASIQKYSIFCQNLGLYSSEGIQAQMVE